MDSEFEENINMSQEAQISREDTRSSSESECDASQSTHPLKGNFLPKTLFYQKDEISSSQTSLRNNILIS